MISSSMGQGSRTFLVATTHSKLSTYTNINFRPANQQTDSVVLRRQGNYTDRETAAVGEFVDLCG
jgi:hypothetical protein